MYPKEQEGNAGQNQPYPRNFTIVSTKLRVDSTSAALHTKPKPKWDVHLPEVGDWAGILVGDFQPLIARRFGRAPATSRPGQPAREQREPAGNQRGPTPRRTVPAGSRSRGTQGPNGHHGRTAGRHHRVRLRGPIPEGCAQKAPTHGNLEHHPDPCCTADSPAGYPPRTQPGHNQRRGLWTQRPSGPDRRAQTLPEGPASRPETGAFPAKLPSGHPTT